MTTSLNRSDFLVEVDYFRGIGYTERRVAETLGMSWDAYTTRLRRYRQNCTTDEYVTGHPVGDAVLPAAQQLVRAVRAGDSRAILDAVGAAYEAADHAEYWTTALVVVLAGMVPDDATPATLLAWNLVDAS